MKFTDKEQRAIDKAKKILQRSLVSNPIDLGRSENVIDFLKLNLSTQDHEVFAVLFLSLQYTLIEYKELFIGTINSTQVHPRIIAQEALKNNAAAIILAHNHPSGESDASDEDIDVTKNVIDALKLIDVDVLDHIIVTPNSSTSFAEKGIMP